MKHMKKCKRLLSALLAGTLAAAIAATGVPAGALDYRQDNHLQTSYWQDDQKYYYNKLLVTDTKLVVDDKLYQFDESGESAVLADKAVTWSSGTLDSAIAAAYGKTADELTNEDYTNVCLLDISKLSALSVADAAGLEATVKHLTNLTELISGRSSALTAEQLKYFANLKSLTKINMNTASSVYENLSLFKDNVTTLKSNGDMDSKLDLKKIAELKKLKNLSLWVFRITDVSPLSSLKSLVTLDLSLNEISNIKPLEKLTNLKSLDIGSNNIKSIASVGKLTGLEVLSIGGNNALTNIDAVAKLTKLRFLDMTGSPVKSVSKLSGLTSLRYLYFESTKVSDLSPLAKLTNMYMIRANNNPISDFSPLAKMTYLKKLDVGSAGKKPSKFAALDDLPLTRHYGGYSGYYLAELVDYGEKLPEDDDGLD